MLWTAEAAGVLMLTAGAGHVGLGARGFFSADALLH